MGWVSYLDQLGLQVLCVQENQSPLMSTLSVDQPFRYDGFVGTHGRERVSCSTLPRLRPFSLGLLTRSFFAALAHACSLSPSCFAAPLKHPAPPRGGL